MNEPVIRISKRGAERVAGGHLWVYRGDVEKAPTELQGGEVVALKDGRGRFLAKAFWSARSKIAIRILTRDEEAIDDAFFSERIQSALALRARLWNTPVTDPSASMRLVHGESDLLPGLIADKYGDVVVLQTLSPGMEKRKALLIELFAAALQPRSIVERNDVKVRELEGMPLLKGVLRGPEPGIVDYIEGRVRLKLDILGGQKTGAFLDQRENHVRAGEYATGKCLDCFSYAGAFALQMAPRAERVTAIEISAAAAASARENGQLNGANNVDVVEANAFDFLKDASEKPPDYDVVVLDPPAFAKNKDSLPAARRGYKEINLRALQILKPGGLLVTSSCSYHLSEAMLEATVLDAANDAGRKIQLLERRGASRDHPVLMGVPETQYLKCLFIRAL